MRPDSLFGVKSVVKQKGCQKVWRKRGYFCLSLRRKITFHSPIFPERILSCAFSYQMGRKLDIGPWSNIPALLWRPGVFKRRQMLNLSGGPPCLDSGEHKHKDRPRDLPELLFPTTHSTVPCRREDVIKDNAPSSKNRSIMA